MNNRIELSDLANLETYSTMTAGTRELRVVRYNGFAALVTVALDDHGAPSRVLGVVRFYCPDQVRAFSRMAAASEEADRTRRAELEAAEKARRRGYAPPAGIE